MAIGVVKLEAPGAERNADNHCTSLSTSGAADYTSCVRSFLGGLLLIGGRQRLRVASGPTPVSPSPLPSVLSFLSGSDADDHRTRRTTPTRSAFKSASAAKKRKTSAVLDFDEARVAADKCPKYKRKSWAPRGVRSCTSSLSLSVTDPIRSADAVKAFLILL
ncbi:hypothetical protein DFH08DRAFT_1047128 [Mycena albidolilacea]|uniref:Uncharacterized protein n=1 Tax=Mycena albidolilacea TaxID=1033008 RepID=A0AAD7EY38_9AGAR|nr:hypothetical protein DFH08DRAFT_1047128 [Mycena albidolilacea]